jgi:hypothetical protein
VTIELVPGNIEVLAFAFQVDKDTPATVPTIAINIEDCSLDPAVQRDKQAQSDQFAQQGDVAVMGAQPGGTFKKYMRPSEEDFFLAAQLGLTVDSGTTPKLHTSTMDPDAPFVTPYLTCWDIWPGAMGVRYEGLRLASSHFMGKADGFLEAEYTIAALKAIYFDPGDAPDLTGLFATELGFSWPELAVSLGGDHAGTVNSIDCTISRATGRFKGDNGLASLDVPNGLFSVAGSAEVAFVSDDLARAANTGSTSGTDLTAAIFSEALSIVLARGANLGVALTLAAAQISNFQTAFKADASTATSTFDFNSKRSTTLGDVITAVTKNAIAHADRSA